MTKFTTRNKSLVAIAIFAALCLHYSSLAQTAVTYTESSEDFMNPDRGFYTPVNGIASNFQALTVAQLQSWRNTAYTPYQGNYSVRTAVVLRHYVLDLFVKTPLSAAFMNGVQADFNAARQAGVRLILRFSYTITPKTGNCGSWICPPYGDATKAIILNHIAQLKPYFQKNSDAILAVQNGFIGVWGEQYYTDNFGDASKQGKLTDQNWADRIAVLKALLDAVPVDRMVQVRYPQLKQKAVYGIAAPVSSAAMTAAQAYKQTLIARIGFHNDCFLSASDDQGTYWDYGTTATSAADKTSVLKPYAANDSKYVAVGGETCDDAFSPQNDCSGIARTDMDNLNYSYLNSDYNNAVNNDWQTDNCMDDIKRRLGYRFVLKTGSFPASVLVGGSLTFTLNIANMGFAAPFNARTLQLVLRNTANNQVYKVDITGTNSDTRFWLSGTTTTLNPTIALPTTLTPGTYTLLLNICDKSNGGIVATRPEFSIQMANNNTWEATTGYNKLNHTLTITANNPPPVITIDGNGAEWANIPTIATTAAGLTSLKATSNATDVFFFVQGTVNTNYNVLINTDNNNTTGFKNGFWAAHGSDYLLQNGSLLKYNGIGGAWGWTATGVNQTGVQAVKTATALEVKIPRANLMGLATTIKVGVETSNANWVTTAIIPAITSPQASYAFPSPAIAEPNNPPTPLSIEPYFYPNPSNGTMTLSFFVEQDNSDVEVFVYSLMGTPVKRFTEQNVSRGQQEKTLILDELSRGTYIVKTIIGDAVTVKRVMIVK